MVESYVSSHLVTRSLKSSLDTITGCRIHFRDSPDPCELGRHGRVDSVSVLEARTGYSSRVINAMRRIRSMITPAFLVGWSLFWFAGGCGGGPSSSELDAANKQNIEDEKKASENTKKGVKGI
jgi:hypothetical protein